MAESYLGDNLIFIISQPRSGSTLLQRVLSGHSAVSASSEPWVMLHPVYGRRTTGIWTEFGADWAVRGVNEFLEHYTDGDEAYDDGLRAFAKTIYDNALGKAGGTIFIDKTPRYLLILPDLLRLFPRARFIFLLRNPLSVLASIVNTQIAHDLTTLERFTPELLDGPQAMLDGIAQLGDAAIVVRYEDFVQAPEEHTRQLCQQLDLTYEEGMVDYADREPVQGYMQDRTGITQHTRPSDTRLESWKQLLGDAQQLHFAHSYLQALGPEMFAALGYAFDELNEAVRAAQSRVTGKPLLPWSTALTEPDFMEGMDQLSCSLYLNVRDHGPVLGRIKTIGSFFTAVLRQVQWIFGRVPQRRAAQRGFDKARRDGPHE